MPPGTILLTPISTPTPCRATNGRHPQGPAVCGRARLHGLRGAKQGVGPGGGVALELRGTRTAVITGGAVPSQCNPYSLYVQLSRCPSLDGIMLLSGARERDVADNTVPKSMAAAEKRLE